MIVEDPATFWVIVLFGALCLFLLVVVMFR